MQRKIEINNYMKRYLVSLWAALIVSASAWAVMATPEPIVKRQSDGSSITLQLRGDEFHSYYTLTDGTPVRLEKGMWVKDASVAEQPQSARRARRIAQEKNLSGTFPLTGSPKSVVILVNFSDLKFQYKLEDFQMMLNESGYNKNGGIGSARDYFIACSDSVFAPQFDCYGPVTLSRGYAYYGGNSGGSSSAHASQMVVEACNLVADELGVDMTQYDTNDDGRLDNVFIYYAGHNEAEGASANTIWPHRSIVGGNERVQGKLIYDYACTSELRGSSGTGMCGIGTFCHEFGHVLGLPDYYDTGYNYYTVGTWDIMCSGSYNGNGKTPPTYTSGERFELGWLTPTQLTAAGPYTLEPLENGHASAYLIAKSEHNLSWSSASPSEYWLLENRQRVGWDAAASCLPSTGMLIWHIDYSASAWGSNTPNNYLPLRYDIEEAGGQKGYSAASDPFPGSRNVTSFTPVLHNNEMLDQPLLDIAQDGQNIVFTFKSASGDNFMFVPAQLPVIQSTYNPDDKKAVTPAEKVKLVGSGMIPGDMTITMTGSGFQVSKDSSAWNTSLTLTIGADSLIEQYVYVRYAPKKQVCDIQQGRMSVRHAGGTAGTYVVRGTSPRPTLIETPDITELSEVTPTSFKTHWTPQADAEYYYVTLYHLEDGTESTMESFEGFDDELVVKESGWYTSFYRTTTKAKEEGAVSMWFKENAENIISPIYHLPVTEISFWLNAPATTDTEVGFFTLMAFGEVGIDTLDKITVTKNTKKYTYTRSLDEAKGYRRFALNYTSIGGEGVCVDAFTTTFNQKTIYTYKGREYAISTKEGTTEEQTSFYAYDLIPDMNYYVALQCSENKGCTEHLSEMSMPLFIHTKPGELPDSKRLTLAYDSISYDPATHVVYLPQSLVAGSICIYTTNGELVKQIPVAPHQNIVVLPDGELNRDAVYIVKYLPENKLGRKAPWIKIIYK